ncbi:MAG: hypothetical protein LBJ00_06390 [Planctomycetaceae bacterium]|nr:hypothetical protein [Planctomycetaceae bacterium]
MSKIMYAQFLQAGHASVTTRSSFSRAKPTVRAGFGILRLMLRLRKYVFCAFYCLIRLMFLGTVLDCEHKVFASLA